MPIVINLNGPDGNSASIIGMCRVVLRRCGKSDLIPEYTKKAMSSDRENLLEVTKEYSQGIIVFEESSFWGDDLEDDLENE